MAPLQPPALLTFCLPVPRRRDVGTSQQRRCDTNYKQSHVHVSFSTVSIALCLCDFPLWLKRNVPNRWFFCRNPIISRWGYSLCWCVLRSLKLCVNIKHYEVVSSPVVVHFAANLTTGPTKKLSFSLTSPLGCRIFCANVQISQRLDPWGKKSSCNLISYRKNKSLLLFSNHIII